MLGPLNHIAIAVPNVADAARIYRDTFGMGAKVSRPVPQPDQGVTTVFIELPNTKIELIEPLGANSPIEKFLQKYKNGGIHHVCYEVTDIIAARDHMLAQGATVTGTGEPTIGAHGNPVIFLHPKDFNGTLIELEQV
jgi:methylmalonyl-CoA/ethylmalonyl-CoA epimerase